MAGENDNNNTGQQAEASSSPSQSPSRSEKQELRERIRLHEQILENQGNQAELSERQRKILELQNEILEIRIKIEEAIKKGREDIAKSLVEEIQGLKATITELEKVEEKLKGAAEFGEKLAERLVGLRSPLIKAAQEAGSFSSALNEAAEKFFKKVDSVNLFAVAADRLLSTTKDLVFELDSLQADFVRNTGASRDFAENAFKARSELAFLGLTGKDAVETMGRLYSGMSEFSQLSDRSQRDFTVLAAQIERLGGNAAEMGQVFTKVANMDISETGRAMQRVAGIADAVGIPLSQLSSDIAGLGELFAKMGDQGLDTFAGLSAAAKETGLSVQELYGIVGQYDDFNNAAAAAGRLNMVLGGNLIDTYSLLSATEEERVALLQETLQASGRTFEELDRMERIELASALNIPLQQAAQLFNTTSGEVQKTAAEIMHANMSTEELADRTRDAATAQDKLNVLMGNFAIAIGPIVEVINKVVDGFLRFTEAITGGNGVGVAIGSLTFGLTSLWLISKLVGVSMGVAFKTAAKSISTSAPAISQGLASIGASAGGAAAGVGTFALAVVAIGASIAGVVLSIGFLVSKIGEIVAMGPEAAASFLTISTGVLALAGALAIMSNPFAILGLGTLAAAIGTISYAIGRLDLNKVESFGEVLSSLDSLFKMQGIGAAAQEVATSVGTIGEAIEKLNLSKVESFSEILSSLASLFRMQGIGAAAQEIANSIGTIGDAIDSLPDDQTKALTFATTADALTNLTNAAATIEEAKLASMAALVQAMTNTEGDNGIGQLANAIQNLITTNAEERETTIQLDGYNLGRWIDRRETRNARVVLSGQNG